MVRRWFVHFTSAYVIYPINHNAKHVDYLSVASITETTLIMYIVYRICNRGMNFGHFFQNIYLLRQCDLCCCQVVWQIGILGIKIFLFHISINLFRSWHTIVKNKLMRISLFFMNVCQLRNKFMLMWNKNIFIWFVHFCQTTWQQQITSSSWKFINLSS